MPAEIIPLFSQPLYKNHFEFKQPDLSNIEWVTNKDNEISRAQNILDLPEFAELSEVAYMASAEYIYGVMAVVEHLELVVTSSWLNRSMPGMSHPRHWHPNNLASGVIYLDTDPRAGGAITWLNDRKPRVNLDRKQSTLWNTNHWVEQPVTGDCFVFPSEVDHWVEKNTGLKPRISLAWNVFVKGQLNSEINL